MEDTKKKTTNIRIYEKTLNNIKESMFDLRAKTIAETVDRMVRVFSTLEKKGFRLKRKMTVEEAVIELLKENK